MNPWVVPWDQPLDIPTLLRRLSRRPHCLLLDSAMQHASLGRYSFLMADPVEVFTAFTPEDGLETLRRLQQAITCGHTARVEGLPPFQGGAAGVLSYEFGQCLEKIPQTQYDEFQCPAAMIGVYDVILAIDHQLSTAWVISQGYPELEESARKERAERRGREFLTWITRDGISRDGSESSDGWREAYLRPPLTREQLAPQFPVADVEALTSDFSGQRYRDTVQRTIDYIYAGDIFQVNLSQRFLYPAQGDVISLYLRLRERNPATFAGYFDMGDFQVLSASPERFVSVREGVVETRPIKGTRRRLSQVEADLYSAAELHGSEKDRAENVMIVDLLRNDLSRVCDDSSICVTQLCELEQYEFVQHLVSAVQGRLAANQQPMDLIRAAFPGGSITGAPKVRAMEIIAELEPTARGPYCGSMGYVGFDGAMDWNILIRTITAGRGWWQLPAGGGIVAASQPGAEYQETLDKARGMVRALV